MLLPGGLKCHQFSAGRAAAGPWDGCCLLPSSANRKVRQTQICEQATSILKNPFINKSFLTTYLKDICAPMLHIKAKASWQSQVGLAKPAWLLWPSAARDLWFGGFTLLSFSSSLTHQTQQQRAAQALLSAEEAGVSVCRLILRRASSSPALSPPLPS